MRRREFITLLGGATATWPLAARAQQRSIPAIGYLGFGTPDAEHERVTAIRRGLSELGHVEGRDFAIGFSWAGFHNDLVPTLVQELVRRQVAVMLVNNTPAALAAKAATQSIPIVFSIGSDPVEIGLVASLNRPGGNITGVYNLNIAVAAKRLEVLHELVPTATSFAYLVNPTNAAVTEAETTELQVAARILGVRLLILKAAGPAEFEAAFAAIAVEGAGALLVSSESMFSNNYNRLVALTARYMVPAMNTNREATAAGGLVSFGPDRAESARIIASYTGRILKGDKAADLPVQQVTKLQLAINMNTAKALGITVPTALLVRADEVIE
jgi:putative ABC transport system substrate-binding protein